MEDFDKIKKNSKEYNALSRMDRWSFDELDAPDFDHIVKQIEKKSNHSKKIRLIQKMHLLRLRVNKKTFDSLDNFE